MAASSFRIDPKFKALLDPLTREEYEQLFNNCTAEGRIRDPIVVWREKNTILDGHNRYEIAIKQKLPFDVKRMSFETEDDAIMFIIGNQLGRRNLSPERKRYFIGKEYLREKKIQGTAAEKRQSDSFPNSPKDEQHTAEKLAEKHGVSPRTIERAADYAKQVDAAPLSDQASILAGEMPLPARKERVYKPLKPGSELFRQHEFMSDWGKMIRWIDKVARSYGLLTRSAAIKETPEVLGLQRKLTEWKKEFLAWQKELEKELPKRLGNQAKESNRVG